MPGDSNVTHKVFLSQKDIDKLSFGQAFSQKRQELGSGATFIWRGSSYSTNQAGE